VFDAGAFEIYIKNPKARFLRDYNTLGLVDAVVTEALHFRANNTFPDEIGFAQKFYSDFIEPWEETVAAYFAQKDFGSKELEAELHQKVLDMIELFRTAQLPRVPLFATSPSVEFLAHTTDVADAPVVCQSSSAGSAKGVQFPSDFCLPLTFPPDFQFLDLLPSNSDTPVLELSATDLLTCLALDPFDPFLPFS